MLKTLVKKQMLELNRGFFYDQKKGKSRSKGSSILLIALYALLMIGVIGGMFALFAYEVCGAMVSAQMGWLYFLVFTMLSIALGVFGSVFNTFSGLYLAKDNDLLLSLPIPVRDILIARLMGVYLMGLMFSAVILLPVIIVYFLFAPLTLGAVFGALLLLLLVSVFVLVLSCLLGWMVAKISVKLKNKSFVTVFASLAFIAIYYVAYFRANTMIQKLVTNAVTVGAKIRGAAYPLYLVGRVGEGDGLAMLLVSLAILALLALTFRALSRSFIHIATTNNGAAKVRYKETAAKLRPVRAALQAREFARFSKSPNYMLNCGLGTLILPIAGILLVLKGESLCVTLAMLGIDEGFLSVLLTGACCLLASMNDMTAPSVSLEGKSIWLVQSLPVKTWDVLRAKLGMQIWLTAPPIALFSVCAAIVLQPSLPLLLLLMVLPQLCVLLFACFGLFLNLKRPNLNWTTEITPIKQSLSVMLSIFGAWGYGILIAVPYYFLSIDAAVYLLIIAAVTALLDLLLLRWLKTKGAAIFQYL